MHFHALIALFSSSLCLAQMGQDLSHAPPGFQHEGKNLVMVDFQNVELQLKFDASARVAKGIAKIEFFAPEGGYPILDLVPEATHVSLNGQRVQNGLLKVRDPDNQSNLRYVDAPISAMSYNELSISYTLGSTELTWTDSGVRIGFFMSDISAANQQGFLEQYAPANLEYDQFEMDLDVSLENAGSNHRLFTNGEQTQQSSTSWHVRYPHYFTASSFYFHLTNQAFEIRESTYHGLEKEIPVLVYASTASLADSGQTAAHKILAENEGTFGPFAHQRVVAYITSGGGGMEHVGATVTSLWALEHEFTHFWFARGVMPSSGNSGWIDEAMASWRDNGYPTEGVPTTASNLGNFSAYRRSTTYSAYGAGARLLAYFDSLFNAAGGLRPLMKNLFSFNQRETITTPQFEQFLSGQTGQNLGPVFEKYVYNKTDRNEGFTSMLPFPAGMNEIEPDVWPSRHPRPFTKEEWIELR